MHAFHTFFTEPEKRLNMEGLCYHDNDEISNKQYCTIIGTGAS